MFVFNNRNVITPSRKELLWGLLCWFGFLAGFPLLLDALGLFAEDSLRADFLYSLTVSVCNFVLVLLVFRNFLFRSRLPFFLLIMTCLFGFIANMGIESLNNILLALLYPFLQEDPTNMNQEIVNTFLNNYTGYMILDVVLFAPIVEELLFRGTIFGPLCKRSPLWAYIVSVAAFGAMHVISFIGMQHWTVILFSFLQYLPAGFVLCWSYQRSQSIWTPIALHGIMNLYSSIMILTLS